ncbi:hypothetical protein SGRA_3283 [Saprospira grandis str. Lewin]|uniref:Uncharacterized protein n=1 Tax=Saprospira grandis (strain Lewin) TaxID=984262 RepID=H6L004_SAPGL|nr:hypothetical protein SGRA_3283 [Saprospira grandis str. Lewin]
MIFWGLLPTAGATLWGSLFARPCGGFAALVWPDGHPAASLGRLACGHGLQLKSRSQIRVQ